MYPKALDSVFVEGFLGVFVPNVVIILVSARPTLLLTSSSLPSCANEHINLLFVALGEMHLCKKCKQGNVSPVSRRVSSNSAKDVPDFLAFFNPFLLPGN